MIILGVDPGLTRCGVGVIEAGAYRRLSFIHVDVVRSDPKMSQDLRLLAIYNGLVEKIERFAPDTVSIERVFAQENRNTVLGTAQAAGLAMLLRPRGAFPSPCIRPLNQKWRLPATARPKRFRWNAWSPVFWGSIPCLSRRCRRCVGYSDLSCASPRRRVTGGEREQHLTDAQRQWLWLTEGGATTRRP